MKTCPYCGSETEKYNDTHDYYCEFCVMKISADKIQENGERVSVRVRDFVLDVYGEKTTPELMLYSTYELLFILKSIRTERSEMYKFMSMFYKAKKETGTDDYSESEKDSGDMYLNLTKRMFVVENIIRERLGYVPTRITENYLSNYLKYIRNDKVKPMQIRTERKESV